MAQSSATDRSEQEQATILLNVLNLEARYGFNNSAVTGGGLDGMWSNLPTIAPRVKSLAPMKGRAYADLTYKERRAWAIATRRILLRRSDSDLQDQTPRTRNGPEASSGNPKTLSNPANLTIESPVEAFRSIHHRLRETLQKLGLQTLRDAMWRFPLRHIDYTQRTSISELVPGADATVIGEVCHSERAMLGGRQRAAKVRVKDDTGFLSITWFNMPYMAERWKIGDRIVVSGKASKYRGQPTMENPEYDDLVRNGAEVSRIPIHAGSLMPVYSATEGVNQRSVRTAINRAIEVGLPLLNDPLPDKILHANSLISLLNAVKNMHRPESPQQIFRAKRRLAFDEFLYNQIAALRRRAAWKNAVNTAPSIPDIDLVKRYIESLDFDLTGDQSAVLRDILDDIGSGLPMARLLQGEVGSGKTVVAIAAMLYVTGQRSGQAALLAPTEVLAEQHFLNALQQLDCRPMFGAGGPIYESNLVPSGETVRKLRLALLIGSLREADKSQVQRMCASGEIDLVIGTHALLQERVDFHKLSLAVVDEQQRFGTEQRAVLTDRTPRPHLLAMSATPIPRTLHMTFYGELDISILRELPHGRKDVETRWARSGFDEHEALNEIRRQVQRGRQAFIVCPLIEPSENVPGASAISAFERFSQHELSDLRVGLLHGRMSLADKQSVMNDFRARKIDVLVATPVIEVGVDVPNATVMLILTAEQFGLSQLHQIRGRVGRGEHPGLCILVSDSESETAAVRLQSLVDSADGFGLAAKDLEMRGPGRNLESAQSGWSGWTFAHFSDLQLLRQARAAAEQILEQDFEMRKHPLLRRELIRVVGKAPSAFA